MCEMLANQYFMMRRYPEAMEIFEKIYPKEKSNVKVIAKLIICLIYNKNVDKAFQIFIDNVSNDPLIFFNTALKNEDCPCSDIIKNIENDFLLIEGKVEKKIALGILWSYCDINKATEIFEQNNLEYNKYLVPEIILTQMKNTINHLTNN